MDSLFMFMGFGFSLMTIGILITSIVLVIGVLSTNFFKLFMWNFLNIPYKKVEVIHDGIIRDRFYVKNNEVKDGIYKTKSGKEYPLKDIFNPIHERSNCIRYTFKNDNVLPFIAIEGDIPTIKGLNNYEIITKAKSGKHFIISNLWFKNMLEEHFVEKIKKEKQTGWEAILAWLSTPTGAIVCMGIIILIGFGLWVNMHK